MDRLVFLSTAALGVAFLVLYGFRCWRREEQVEVGALVNIMLEAGGVVAGAFLILSTLFPELKSQLATVDLYIFISGLVVLAVSAQRLKRDIWPSTPRIPGAQPSAALAPIPGAGHPGDRTADRESLIEPPGEGGNESSRHHRRRARITPPRRAPPRRLLAPRACARGAGEGRPPARRRCGSGASRPR